MLIDNVIYYTIRDAKSLTFPHLLECWRLCPESHSTTNLGCPRQKPPSYDHQSSCTHTDRSCGPVGPICRDQNVKTVTVLLLMLIGYGW